MPSIALSIALTLPFLVSSSAQARIRLPSIIGDHMVLQRGNPVVWGWATPGATITVAIADVSASTTSDASGLWTVVLSGIAAGGPHEMTIRGDGTVTVDDVLTGDVWLGSGQSNMEMATKAARGIPVPAASADCAQIRLFTVPWAASTGPVDDTGGAWHVCTPDTVRDFSAVAYSFGHDLESTLKLPVGLIVSAWGSTPIVVWTPSLGAGPSNVLPDGRAFTLEFSDMHLIARDPARAPVALRVGEGDGFGGMWSAAAKAGSVATLTVDTTGDGSSSIARFTGSLHQHDAWAAVSTPLVPRRTPTDLTPFTALGFRARGHGTFRLDLAQPSISDADDYASLPFRVGEEWQSFALRFDALAQSGWGLPRPFTPEAITALAFTVVAPPPLAPAVVYNAMIHPLTRLRVRGVLWYQGEADAGEPAAYGQRLTTLIARWRAAWGDSHLPFLIVQLPGYADAGSLGAAPGSWAEIREAQRQTTQMETTALVTTIDLGDSHDIHPRNKGEVGRRLALAALRLVYHRDVLSSGPVLTGATRAGDRLLLEFRDVGEGLVARGGTPLTGFTLSDDGRTFHTASARIVGPSTVAVSSDLATAPIAARYGWADDPICNLIDGQGLPASPFRVTLGEVPRERAVQAGDASR